MLEDTEKNETVSLGKAAGILNEINELGVKRWILIVEGRRENGGCCNSSCLFPSVQKGILSLKYTKYGASPALAFLRTLTHVDEDYPAETRDRK